MGVCVMEYTHVYIEGYLNKVWRIRKLSTLSSFSGCSEGSFNGKEVNYNYL